MKGGLRVPYIMVLDDELTVLEEYAESTKAAPPSDRVDRALAEWAVASIAKNPIPGTDELRAEFLAARAALEQSYVAVGEDCPGCELGKLMRRYRERMEAGGHLAQLR